MSLATAPFLSCSSTSTAASSSSARLQPVPVVVVVRAVSSKSGGLRSRSSQQAWSLRSSSSGIMSGQVLDAATALGAAAAGAPSEGGARRTAVEATVSSSDNTTKEEAGSSSSSSKEVREVPGSYGLPVLGKLKDRLDYFWFQGTQEFFSTRIAKHGTVFRTHMPPGWPDGRVIMLCDQKSFPVLFDTDKVDKTDIFTGTYMSDVSFTGGYRVLPYLDPSEPRHTQLKGFCFDVLRNNGTRFLPEFHRAIGEAYAVWESQLADSGKSADFRGECSQFTFDFLMRAIARRDPVAPGADSLGAQGAGNLTLWIALQLAPGVSSGILPKWLDELLLHTFRLPFWPAAGGYTKVFKFLETYATDMVDIATRQHGLLKDDALHNLFFFINFNTHGGLNILFPSVISYLAGRPDLHAEIAAEVRARTGGPGQGLTRQAVEDMKLVASVVYEVLRISPPVPYQYGRAKRDFVLESWDGAFQIKKGELLGGAQPVATKDPRVFSDPSTFQPKRFLGEEGEKLLRYVLWSNGPETESPQLANKQCAGKEFVVFITRVFVAEFFQRYDTYEVDSSLAFTKLVVAADAAAPATATTTATS